MSNVFIGDSVTDCDRLTIPPYGNGWVNEIVKSGVLQDVINVGISGNRLVDLEARWNEDVFANNPKLLSIAIGINETGHRYQKNDITSTEDFAARYDRLLNLTISKFNLNLVLCEPFLLHVKPEMEEWREDLNPKIEVIHLLAAKYNAKLVKFDEMFSALSKFEEKETFAKDGVHPTQRGHLEMAKLWKRVVLGL